MLNASSTALPRGSVYSALKTGFPASTDGRIASYSSYSRHCWFTAKSKTDFNCVGSKSSMYLSREYCLADQIKSDEEKEATSNASHNGFCMSNGTD